MSFESESPEVAAERNSIPALWDSLHRDLRRRGVSEHDAEDFTQEAWLRTFRRPPKDPSRLRAWLSVVGRRVHDEIARQSLWRRDRERHVARFEAVAGDAVIDSRVVRLVDELPSPYREVVQLRFVKDLEVEEIAERLARSPAAVRSQLRRGLARLRERLEGDPSLDRRARAWLAALLLRLKTIRRTGARWAIVAAALVLVAGWWWPRAGTREERLALADALAPPRESWTAPRFSAGERSTPTATPSTIPPTSVASSWTFAGIVRTPDGKPVAGAEVFSSGPFAKSARRVALTDALGRFSAEGLTNAPFLFATAEGWLPTPTTQFAAARADRPADLVLQPAHGRVEFHCTQDGRPLSGARVELHWSAGHPPRAWFSAAGALGLENERVGGWTDAQGLVTLARPGRQTFDLVVTAGARVNHHETITLEEGNTARELDLSSQARLHGIVRDLAGHPVPRARLELTTRGPYERVAVEADAAGSFELGLDPGPFELHARESTGARRTGFTTGTLVEGERHALTLVLDEAGVVRGTALVAGVPLADAPVLCTTIEAHGPKSRRALTDRGGRFEFARLSTEAEYTLELYDAGSALLARRDGVRSGDPEVVLAATHAQSATRTVALEFTSADPAWLPTLVERVCAEIVPVDARTGRCSVQVPVETTTSPLLVAWVPSLGTIPLEREDLEGDGVHRFRVPNPAHVTFTLTGATPADVRGGVRIRDFGGAWVSDPRGIAWCRELKIDPTRARAEVWLLPGEHRYFFGGDGIAEAGGTLTLREGEERIEPVQLERGSETRILVPYADPGGVPTLIACTREREWELGNVPVELEPDHALFRARLGPSLIAVDAVYRGLRGTAAVTGPEIRIDLKPGPR